MLSGIKDKIRNVKKNVNLFNSIGSEKPSSTDSVNLNAGAPLLQHFQDQWVEIHENNERNTKQAEDIAEGIQNVAIKVASDKDNLELITYIVSESNLTGNITQCLNQINKLYNICEEVEEGLVNLQILIDEIDFQNLKNQHKYHLDQFDLRKQEMLETVKENLEQKYREKRDEREKENKKILEERQKVFQEAFKSDLELYKNLGTIPKMDLPKTQNGALLEEIQLDFDESELNQFFNEN